jgi:hypothetical protein
LVHAKDHTAPVLSILGPFLFDIYWIKVKNRLHPAMSREF